MKQNQHNVLTVPELSYILNLNIETVKNKLDNYQFNKFAHRNGKNPTYAITLTPASIDLIKKIVIPKNRQEKAMLCLNRFEKWLCTGEV